ncbi:hypothetical protein Golob_027627, partial [Gossypium lobatum]|nr:hypothetical protein [Gossypium lobatum]
IIYVQAIVPEPVISLRAASEDCTLSTGYHIPSGTRLMKIMPRGLTSLQDGALSPRSFLAQLKVGKPSKLA